MNPFGNETDQFEVTNKGRESFALQRNRAILFIHFGVGTMRCKQVRQHKQRSTKQVYEIWSNQVRRNRPNLVDKIRSEKSVEMPDIDDRNTCWGIAQPR